MADWRWWRKHVDAEKAHGANDAAASGPAPVVLAALEQALKDQGAARARELTDQALAAQPEDATLRLFSSRVHRRLGNVEAAIADCEQALATADEPARVQLSLAECHVAAKDLPAALEALDVALTLDEQLAAAWLLQGELLAKLDRNAEATKALKQAIELGDAESLPRAHHALGRVHASARREPDAIASYEACLALDAEHINAWIGLGDALLLSDEEPRAIAAFEKALSLTNTQPSGLLLNMAVAQQQLGRRAEARRTYEAVLSQEPGSFLVRWYMAQLDLLECRWPQAWQNYGARLCVSPVHYRPLPYKRWSGEDAKADTLLVLAGEGLGDEIMYASCLPDAIAHTGHCIIDCDPRLVALYKRSFPAATVVSSDRSNQGDWLQGLPQPQWQIPASELPTIFRRADDDFPAHRGYLRADASRVAAWAARLQADLGRSLKVGLSWRGGTARTRAKTRSITTEQWQPILSRPGVSFVNLQYGDYQDELKALEQQHGIHITDYPEALADYDETAALVSSLDLVVTVCTAIVHLSGALGQPVWVLTPHSPGWRYTAERQSMPWYPSSRIFRQPSPGDWATPCQELSVALQDMTLSVSTSAR